MAKGVQIFPSGLQAMGPQAHETPIQYTASSAKLFFRIKLGKKLFKQHFFSPIFSASAFFGFIAQGIGIALFLALLSSKKAFETSTRAAIGAIAFCTAVFCWAIIQTVATPFRVLKEERLLGNWYCTRFVYNQPQRVLTKEWTPTDNDQPQYFAVPDIPPGALVTYKIEVDGPIDRLNCILLGAYYFSPVADMLKSARFALRGKVRLRKDRTLFLNCLSMPNTLPAVIRVFILAWEIDNTILLDYTDDKSGTRIVLGPPN
jgi:hypothetical protein